ncbi:AraC family transcriptional regulator [Hymenobacter bucti]|uniref:Helix-turn-helix domain-containing protein n=1 Tax=Hymenobacter bucti TaxID=1844114 RepID=A0ABW4R1G8_9BACT
MKEETHKSRGFAGERIIEIPGQTEEKCWQLPVINGLFLTKIGFYPKAQHHYYQRPSGFNQAILLYCTDGQGWIQLPQGRVELRADEVFIIRAGVPHAYGADAHNSWTIHWLHLSGHQSDALAEALMAEARSPALGLPVPFAAERMALFDRIYETLLKGYSPANLLFANLSLAYFLASFVQPDSFRPSREPLGPVSATGKAITFMQANLSRALTVAGIAEAAHLSVAFFSRKFKQDTGYAPIEYFNHLRIQRACQLLHFSQLRVNEVAAELGIDDPLYFSRLFRKQMGVSPAAYRRGEALLHAAPRG